MTRHTKSRRTQQRTAAFLWSSLNDHHQIVPVDDFVVSRAVMPLGDMVPLVRRLIDGEDRNAVPNGLLCLKGGDLGGEVSQYGNKVLIDELASYFKEEFFKTKKVVYLPL